MTLSATYGFDDNKPRTFFQGIARPLRTRHHLPLYGNGNTPLRKRQLPKKFRNVLRLGFYFFAVYLYFHP